MDHPLKTNPGKVNPWISNKLLLFLTILISTGYFVLAINSFNRGERKTFDEIVYHRMGLQLQEDMNAYHTLPLVQANKSPNQLPEYLSRPLFKHPPLFSYFILIAQLIGGNSLSTSAIVPAFFGAATILLTYLLGSLYYSNTVGFFAAFLLAINPIHIICGQKIWLATTLTFFMTAAIFLTLLALKRKEPMLLLLAAMAIGFASLTKYPGLLLLPVLALPVYFSRPPRWILLCFLGIPFLCLIPWIQWNVEVYGKDFLWNSVFIHFHKSFRQQPGLIYIQVIATTLLATIILILLVSKKVNFRSLIKINITPSPPGIREMATCGLAGLLFIPILNGLNFAYFPDISWVMGYFSGRPPSFYLERMLTYAPLSAAAFLLIPWLDHHPTSTRWMMFLGLLLLCFFIVWGAYQCRYIAPIVPIFSVLTSISIKTSLRTRARLQVSKVSLPVNLLICLSTLYAIIRIIHFNITFSYPNTACYF